VANLPEVTTCYTIAEWFTILADGLFDALGEVCVLKRTSQ
jgi:hypothetical protein